MLSAAQNLTLTESWISLRTIWLELSSHKQKTHLMDAEELLERYAAGERCLRGINLHGADLRGIDLRGVDLSDANLSDTDLSDADLRDADLIGADLSGADLIVASLSAADLRDANLHDANLIGAKLGVANLRDADLSGANLSGAELSCTDLTCSNLSAAYMSGATLIKAKLSGANLQGANLSVSNMIGADLSGADLRGANLSGANLIEANLEGAKLQGAKLSRSNLAYVNLTEADLGDADLSDANLAGTDLTNAELENTNLEGTIISLGVSLNINNPDPRIPYEWNGRYFRSKTEMKMAQAFDRAGVPFYLNGWTRINRAKSLDSKEADFLIFYQNKWGILEVIGELSAPPACSLYEPERVSVFATDEANVATSSLSSDRPIGAPQELRLFKVPHIQVVEYYEAARCWEEPDIVVQEFLEILNQV